MVNELSNTEFDSNWRTHHEAVFVDRDFDKRPFRNPKWTMVCVGSPAFYFDSEVVPADAQHVEHRALYLALEKAILEMGDTQIAGLLRGGPYSSPSIFLSSPPYSSAMYQMRFAAVAGFDLNIFGKSETWGAVISWEEEVAIVGGSALFMQRFERLAGGRKVILDNFEWSAAYLEEVGAEQREFAGRLRAHCFSNEST